MSTSTKLRTTEIAWPHGKPVPADHFTIPVVDGFDLIVTPGACEEDLADARACAAEIRARHATKSAAS